MKKMYNATNAIYNWNNISRNESDSINYLTREFNALVVFDEKSNTVITSNPASKTAIIGIDRDTMNERLATMSSLKADLADQVLVKAQELGKDQELEELEEIVKTLWTEWSKENCGKAPQFIEFTKLNELRNSIIEGDEDLLKLRQAYWEECSLHKESFAKFCERFGVTPPGEDKEAYFELLRFLTPKKLIDSLRKRVIGFGKIYKTEDEYLQAERDTWFSYDRSLEREDTAEDATTASAEEDLIKTLQLMHMGIYKALKIVTDYSDMQSRFTTLDSFYEANREAIAGDICYDNNNHPSEWGLLNKFACLYQAGTIDAVELASLAGINMMQEPERGYEQVSNVVKQYNYDISCKRHGYIPELKLGYSKLSPYGRQETIDVTINGNSYNFKSINTLKIALMAEEAPSAYLKLLSEADLLEDYNERKQKASLAYNIIKNARCLNWQQAQNALEKAVVAFKDSATFKAALLKSSNLEFKTQDSDYNRILTELRTQVMAEKEAEIEAAVQAAKDRKDIYQMYADDIAEEAEARMALIEFNAIQAKALAMLE